MNNLMATGVRQPMSNLGLGSTCQPVLTHHIKPPQHREQRGGSQRGAGREGWEGRLGLADGSYYPENG